MCKDTAKTWIVQEKTLFIESRMSDKSKLEEKGGGSQYLGSDSAISW